MLKSRLVETQSPSRLPANNTTEFKTLTHRLNGSLGYQNALLHRMNTGQTDQRSGQASVYVADESEVIESESEQAIDAFLRYKRSTIPIIE